MHHEILKEPISPQQRIREARECELLGPEDFARDQNQVLEAPVLRARVAYETPRELPLVKPSPTPVGAHGHKIPRAPIILSDPNRTQQLPVVPYPQPGQEHIGQHRAI